jgi:hypothetical protein
MAMFLFLSTCAVRERERERERERGKCQSLEIFTVFCVISDILSEVYGVFGGALWFLRNADGATSRQRTSYRVS